MSTPKPGNPCRLVRSFSIGAAIHRNFAETFNWLVSCLENFKGVEGIAEGCPEVTAQGGGTEWTGGFSYVDGEIKPGCVVIGRHPVKVSGLPLKTSSGKYCVKVTLTSSTHTAEIVSGDGFSYPDGNVSYIPLYTIEGGEVIEDYRGATTIPIWE
jgi:hypothetical protein